ncbi:MAG: sulfite exporter TauE/SafE family protein [Actinobacteria bacterium]|nr:sulfite exporter TauE/SafE family protein [Actinomycetota bacterium]NIS33500.1 sulfite exporter TauE/SafE family protein [Actinomycetota bacterium]NIT96917.1 sulfite exporter TauE/SafE family protein [Actinomycetota bacterium]NIU20587.1 sulfite exporter TauE/SafE family protein [Actinomycetota bacterium]NIU68386.1 sulfite exporter TauE/SafE family protein [Actinomycetota bacterium]
MTVFDLTLLELVVGLLAVVAGACLQSSLGFGFGLVAAPVLVLLDPRLVPGPLLCMGVPLTFLVGWRERASLDFSGIKWAIIGRVPGSFLGSVAVVVLAERWLSGLFAVTVLVAVALSVAGLSARPTTRNLFGAGVVSGAMATATSIGGPPMALVYQHASGPALRSTLAAYMVFGAFISLAVLIVVGEFGGTDLGLAAVLVPGVVVGFALSRWTTPWLDRGYIRPGVLTFAAVAAVSILIRQVV